jgi:hypothetical protein
MDRKYGVYRLDINKAPGWFLMQYYDNVKDADLYCLMLTQDTGMVHKVFEEDEDE